MENKIEEVRIESIIALCHILNDYENFKNIVINLKIEDIYDLWSISLGDTVFGKMRMKKFYQENKGVIDIINNYSYYLINFISAIKDKKLDHLYEYLKNHKEELDRVITLITKIKNLGFDYINFDEDLDFTNDIYKMYTVYNDNGSLSYLENMEAIPNYQNNVVEYKTSGSNFRIDFHKFDYSEIILNSLLFDHNKLPEEINVDIMFAEIIALKEKQKKNSIAIRNSVDLNVSISDLDSEFSKTWRVIEGLKDFEDKEKLREILKENRLALEKLKAISSKYDESIINSDELDLTEDQLKLERERYLERRREAKIDWC